MFKLLHFVLLFCFAAGLSYPINPPRNGSFPSNFWNIIEADKTLIQYGDPAWVKRLEERKNLMEEISSGRIPHQELSVDNFILPVLLGGYSDKAGTISNSSFQNHLFGSNPNGNMTQYYNEVSYGQFNLTGTVHGWFTADQTQAYYASNNNGLSNNYPNNGKGFVRNIVQKSDATVNYALYDNDGPDGIPNSGDDDGYADAVIVVYAGAGPDWGSNNNNLWPHMSSLGNNEYTTNDPSANGGFIKVSTYAVCPEIAGSGNGNGQIRPIGVYAHEFGHVLGLPDLYDRTGQSEGVGGWCLMGSGSWGADNAHPEKPGHPSAWCKAEKGWLVPTVLNQNINSLVITDVETAPVAYKLWEDGYGMSRYFLIENRQKLGFDVYLPGPGLIIYHVDENRRWGRSAWSSGPVNDDRTHKLVDIEEADGSAHLDNKVNRGDAGDPFPGTSNNVSFTDNSVPNSKDYSGTSTGVAVTNIASAGLTITANITVRQRLGYGVTYDENGVTGWGWGFASPQDSWGGVLFQASSNGTLEAVDIGLRETSTNYQIDVYRNFQNLTPSNLLGSVTGFAANSGWHTVNLPAGISLSDNESFFVSLKISNKAYAVSYDRYGQKSLRSYFSSNGTTFSHSISTEPSGGDINIRARIKSSSFVNVDDESETPLEFLLGQNYPNPFNPATNFEFQISNLEFVTLKVYDILGKEVAVLVNEEKAPGSYRVVFDASNLSSGVYFYTLKAGEFISSKKLILMK